ncbi:HET-domain-containing protein [Hypoxylon rubiginosum]|uniref:HET-domain-containing protein n=1 Tax=Hypoxylon rubiginosum TaxID=110542 RepID=A0ACB9Z2Z1_9PEZI|nr:HET-domain-containing protein [Hypoxylon rubiginosum]
MHLLNTTTRQVSQVPNGERWKYAILSHTWGSEEITFQELNKYHERRFRGSIYSRAGYQKIRGCCDRAKRDGYDWVWIDTCCIDKTSSAELSEAINSMFKWYRESKVCYVFLSDVSDPNEDFSTNNSSFRASRWFTRGWTLQELLAPRKILFYDCRWKLIGQLSLRSKLCDVVSEITSIPTAYLEGAPLSMANIAHRMSWASKRETTREEDIAYCLLGIFDVNMPLLYGEGARAFRRLQEEIMKHTNDQTLLAWGSFTRDKYYMPEVELEQQEILAASPADFEECNDLTQCPIESASDMSPYQIPYQMTNSCLRIKLPLRDIRET